DADGPAVGPEVATGRRASVQLHFGVVGGAAAFDPGDEHHAVRRVGHQVPAMRREVGRVGRRDELAQRPGCGRRAILGVPDSGEKLEAFQPRHWICCGPAPTSVEADWSRGPITAIPAIRVTTAASPASPDRPPNRGWARVVPRTFWTTPVA